jgi:hypothetical protein
MEEKAGAEMALMLAETLPTDAFTQMGWPSSPAEIVEKWQEFVQTNRKHQAYLDTLFAAARGFTSRMAGFYPGQVPQSAFTTLESHLENIRWASIWQRSNSFDALYQSLNQLAAQFVDQTFLPAAGDSDQNTRWYKENWHLRHMEPGALVSPGISPALAAFLTLAELQAFAYGCGPVTTERVIATRDQYLLDHPSAIVLTSTP